MSTFRFYLIGAQPILLEVAACDIGELGAMLSRQRFIEGQLTEPDGDGLLAGMLLATSRIQCVLEVS